MDIPIQKARDLVEGALRASGFSAGDARIISDHVIGCELRGAPFGGFSRALSVIENMTSLGKRPVAMRVERETEVSALIEGGDQPGYLVAHKATEIAIQKAQAKGIAVVGANNTWYTGMYAHYMEMVTDRGLVGMCAGSSSPRVAPWGSSEGRFGTNPIAFGIPAAEDPIILDISTSSAIVGDAVLAARLGRKLPPDVAYSESGAVTDDPEEALRGAFKVWGGHRGSGLAIIVQLLGILSGGGVLPADYADCGFFVVVLRPDLFMEREAFLAAATAYAHAIRQARPLDEAVSVRVPFQRSAEHRRERLREDRLSIPDIIHASLARIAAGEKGYTNT